MRHGNSEADRPRLFFYSLAIDQDGSETIMTESIDERFLQAAIEEARKGLTEGGIPIGSVLVIDNEIIGRGHNQRIQKGSAILHAEMDAVENAGRLSAS